MLVAEQVRIYITDSYTNQLIYVSFPRSFEKYIDNLYNTPACSYVAAAPADAAAHEVDPKPTPNFRQIAAPITSTDDSFDNSNDLVRSRCCSSVLVPMTSFTQGSTWEPGPPVIPRFVSGREASISNDAQAQHSGAQQPALGDSAGAAALQLGGQQLLNRQIAQLAFLEGAEHVAAGAGGDAGEGTGGGRALRLSAADVVRARTAKGLSRGSVQADTFDTLASNQSSK